MKVKELEIPEDIKVTVDGERIKVEGDNASLERKVSSSRVNIEKKDGKVLLTVDSNKKKDRSELGTYVSHIKNMFRGAKENFEYKMRVVYSHFPIKLETKGNNVLVIQNFLGEKNPRKVDIMGDETKVEILDDELVVKGPNKDAVGQTAAKIEEATHIKGKDPRVFQDGIYIIEKG